MRKLSTIQKRENLNAVFAIDEPGNGGANHTYAVHKYGETPTILNEPLAIIQFQNGARKIPTSIHGVIDTDLRICHERKCLCINAHRRSTYVAESSC